MRSDPHSPPLRAHKDPALPLPPPCTDESTWLAALAGFSPEQARQLLCIARTLCPHDGLGDPPYRRTVLALDQAWQQAPDTREAVRLLQSALDRAHPMPFVQLSESYRVAALKSQEHSAGFRAVQRGTVRFLYDDLAVWQAFGYEGASHHLGGYLTRGFDDLAWLPVDPPDGAGITR